MLTTYTKIKNVNVGPVIKTCVGYDIKLRSVPIVTKIG